MSKSPPGAIERRLEHLLEANARWRDVAMHPGNASPRLGELQRWQSHRLADSFADFLADPGTHDAARFFLTDLYGDHDVSARDRGVERILPVMKRVFPDDLLVTVADAIELAVLSHAFDLRLVRALENRLAPTTPIDAPAYGAAYRWAGLPRLRRRQIELIVKIGIALDAAVRKPWLGRFLRASRWPARVAGLQDLQAFLERGFAAFARMSDTRGFMAEIARREGEVSKRLFAGDDSPFAIPAPG